MQRLIDASGSVRPSPRSTQIISWLQRDSVLGFMRCLFLCFATSAITAAEPLPLTWKAANDCEIKSTKNHWTINLTGNDPYLLTRDVPSSTGELALEFFMKSRTTGGGQLFWSSTNEAGTLSQQNVRFDTTHNLLWQSYRVPFTTEQPIQELRLDPCSAPGELEIAGLRLVDAQGRAVQEWLPRWMEDQPSGNAVIRGAAGASEIVITTTQRLAGAIHSLTWNGKEFIDSHDHGRQLQSACSFGEPRGFHAECFNPTEAGSRLDGAGQRSSSKLLELRTTASSLQSLSQMAFWLAPWELSEGKPALNKESRSNHYLSKWVTIGHKDMPQVIDYRVTFRVPFDERHRLAQFESLTGYMPVDFDHFWGLQASGELERLTDGRGEQGLPIILATADGKFAMGVFSPPPRNAGFQGPRYGRFNFREQNTMKWNCVYRLHDPEGVEPGEYSFQHFVAVGTLETVQQALTKLQAESKQKSSK
jgi:hypothetical protein